MVLTRHDLKQIDIAYLKSLSPEELLAISFSLLQDLQEAHDRFSQSPDNSSRPSGSFAPWEGLIIDEEDDDVSKKPSLLLLKFMNLFSLFFLNLFYKQH